MLDYTNTALSFQKLTGISDEQLTDSRELIENAILRLEAILDPDAVGQQELARCEYAAACCAFYDHACANAGCDNIVTSAEGRASLMKDLSFRIEPARRLRDQTLESLRGLVKDNRMIFTTM